MTKTKFILILLLLAFCLTPLIWFFSKPGFLINGVDTNFPLDPATWFMRRFFVWNAVQNAGADFSSSTAGLLFHLIQYIPYKFGFPLHIVEAISFIFWFSMIVIGSWFLARLWYPKQIFLQVLFSCLYAFNIYLFNTWENAKVANLSLVAAIPFSLSLFWLSFRQQISRSRLLLGFLLISILLSGTGINPAYFISFYLVVSLYCLAEIISSPNKKHIFIVIKNLSIMVAVSLLVNAYWIIPTVNFIFKNISGAQSIDAIGFNNWVESLSTNTSIINIIRLLGAWDWYAFDSNTGLPLYISYALSYFYRTPFIIFSFLLPALAFASFLFYQRSFKVLYLCFSMMVVVGVILGAGTHQPTGVIYKWLGSHIPFFSLFRSPWYIFTPLLLIGINGLICCLFYNLVYSEKILFWRKQLVVNLLVLTLIMGNLVYSYPLVTGRIFRPQSSEGFYVKFPEYIFESKEWLDKRGEYRIVSYPDDEIEKFSWGYRGVESILGLISDNEVFSKSLNGTTLPIADILNQLYIYLKKDQVDLAKSIADKMNIKYLFYKRDQSSLSPDLSQKITTLPKTSFGHWEFYDLSSSTSGKITISDQLYTMGKYDSSEEALALIGPKSLIVNHNDSVVRNILSKHAAGELITTENSHLKRYKEYLDKPDLTTKLGQIDLSKLEFTFETLTEGSFHPVLETYKLGDFGIDYSKPVEVVIDGRKALLTAVNVTDSLIYFSPVSLRAGQHKMSLPVNITSSIYGGDMEKGFSFQLNRDGTFNLEKDGDNTYLNILNRSSKDVTAGFRVPILDPFSIYVGEIRYRHIYGNYAQLVITQTNGQVLFRSQVETFPNYPEWNYVNFFFQPVQVKESNVEIELASPSTKDPLGTKVSFDDLKFHRIFSNKLFFIRNDQAQTLVSAGVEYEKISPVEYRGVVTGAKGAHILAFNENYSPDWSLKISGDGHDYSRVSSQHFNSQGCCNTWLIADSPDSYTFIIYYWPQRLFQLGTIISLLTIISVAGYYFYCIKKAGDD